MLLKKNFLSQKIILFNNKPRFYLSIILGLSFAVSLYAFLVVVREGFRLGTIDDSYNLWVLSDKEVKIYNLFFAFIAVIFGHSYGLSYYIDTPKKWGEKLFWKRNSVLNDQRVLNWYFLYAFFNFTTMTIGPLIFGMKNWFYAFQPMPNYKWMFILIIFVLILQPWNTIRLVYKNRCIKWMAITISTILIVSLALSRINVIDYKSINKIIIAKSPYSKCEFELPKSSVWEIIENTSLVTNIYISNTPKGQSTSDSLFIFANGKELNINNLGAYLNIQRKKLYPMDRLRMKPVVFIHKDVKMEQVDKIWNTLQNYCFGSIAYAVIPYDAEYDQRYYKYYAYKMRIPVKYDQYCSKLEVPPPPPPSPFSKNELMKRNLNLLQVQSNLSGNYILLNNRKLKLEEFKREFTELVKENNIYSIYYQVKKNQSFGEYISFINLCHEIINEQRNKQSIRQHNVPYNDLSFDLQHDLNRQFTLNLRADID